jgi:hypothetical protein
MPETLILGFTLQPWSGRQLAAQNPDPKIRLPVMVMFAPLTMETDDPTAMQPLQETGGSSAIAEEAKRGRSKEAGKLANREVRMSILGCMVGVSASNDADATRISIISVTCQPANLRTCEPASSRHKVLPKIDLRSGPGLPHILVDIP